MNAHDRKSILSRIAEANRVLILLESMGTRDSRKAIDHAVRDAQRAYDALLKSQQAIRFTAEEASDVQDLLDRLKARLKFLGKIA
jgi:hypothetical protein